MKLTESVKFILNTLEAAGYRADIVGGPVRDFLLGKEPSDYDITTSAPPSEIKRVFSEYRTVDTGIKHGTVSLILNGEPYEITTYRIDGEYKDSRHPESVSFTTEIEDDLARRDFTVNAMAYSEKHGLTDAFCGREDLERRIIRAVGDPYIRFSEDALRILRAIRFSSVLGFEIEENTARAARECAHLLDKISAERIYTEWTKLLSGESAYRVILEFSDIITRFLPELSGFKLPSESRFAAANADTRQLSLFASLDNAEEQYRAAMQRLKSPTAPRETGCTVLSALGKYGETNDSTIGRMLYRIGRECALELVRLEELLGTAKPDMSERLTAYLAAGKPYRILDLEIGGEQIRSLGIRGRDIGLTLERLLLAVIDGECENERGALLSRASL